MDESLIRIQLLQYIQYIYVGQWFYEVCLASVGWFALRRTADLTSQAGRAALPLRKCLVASSAEARAGSFWPCCSRVPVRPWMQALRTDWPDLEELEVWGERGQGFSSTYGACRSVHVVGQQTCEVASYLWHLLLEWGLC